MDSFKAVIAAVADGRPLVRDEAERAFGRIMTGEATPAQIGGFLMALRVRGETVDEIAGAVAAMRERMTPVEAPADSVDVVGTGGDGAGSVNVSTCAAFVVAGCGVPVAKHGNRALSSKSGSADVLRALGVDVDIGPERIARCIAEAGIGFMFAPNHHAAMRHVGPARTELGVRTIFNLLGPLSNPAGVRRQMVGVFAAKWVEPIAEALNALGSEKAWVVHGSDGLDEITTSGPTRVAALENGAVTTFDVSPDDAGLSRHPTSALAGGDAEANAAALRRVLDGERGAYRDVAILNAAATLVVAGRAETLERGAKLAAGAIDSGAAYSRLDALVRISAEEQAA
jgi:anthranilate phosphoribosyltransferase